MAERPEVKGDESPIDIHQEKREVSPTNASSSSSPSPKPSEPSGILGFFSRLGNLPEWKVGKKKLTGKALNWSIGICASCGFLMFGYDQGKLLIAPYHLALMQNAHANCPARRHECLVDARRFVSVHQTWILPLRPTDRNKPTQSSTNDTFRRRQRGLLLRC